MHSEKLTLKNRKEQKIVGIYSKPDGEIRGTCVIEHGHTGCKEAPHIKVFQEVFLKHGFQTFNFDATNSFNESEGDCEKSRLGLHYEDFEDVAKWVQQQEWYVGPLAVTGHSWGGYAAARYAENFSEEVAFAAPIAPVVSGELSTEAYKEFDPDSFEKWKQDGYRTKIIATRPKIVKKLPWEYHLEKLNHDLLPDAHKLTMPVFLLSSSKDEGIPPKHIQLLFDAIPEGNKTFKIIEGAPHTYVSEKDLATLRLYIDEWLTEVLT